jgi:hypothetical protein
VKPNVFESQSEIASNQSHLKRIQLIEHHQTIVVLGCGSQVSRFLSTVFFCGFAPLLMICSNTMM